jgi:Cdc6-like AAA superfamily ATPase
MNKVLCIYGKPGVGKTAVTKHVLNQFDELKNACSIILPRNRQESLRFLIVEWIVDRLKCILG